MKLNWARRGLQKKFVASLLIVGFAPGIVALFATYLYSTQTLKTAIGDSFQQLASSTARRIEAMIDDEINEARHLAAVPLTVRFSVEASNRSSRREALQAVRAQLLKRSSRWERFRTGKEPTLPAFINQRTLLYIQNWLVVRPGEYNNIMVTDGRGTRRCSRKRWRRPRATSPRPHVS